MLAFSVSGQKISIMCKDQTLTSALNSISSHYNVKIAFDTQLADKTILNKVISKATIEETLSQLTEGTGMKVQRMGDVFMIAYRNTNKLT